MSLEAQPEKVCYVHCNFCNTILAVSVPCNNMMSVVTVRCGHCANLLSVNMEECFRLTLFRISRHQYEPSSSKGERAPAMSFPENDRRPVLPVRPPEKRQRVPSAYNRFIKEEIQRIKASNPDISHREAFSAAAKNWAHFPYIHFGLNLEDDKQAKVDEAISAEGAPKSHGIY
ncbi:unnamed protein product [Spirodela intermedia]|uniref:Uncharacterized protein n=1 Tax=Spirodela intermedia TaxID=51605 RepID=A0A7I8JAK6_SPIIN|nr:unnamed protein product [Spirodela intermedia]CAA6667124.1 unnamed protein product [Spirodela intermedia]